MLHWPGRSELRGGDVWDGAIRRQIRTCSLFVPLISASSRARAEGYFRLEWQLAVDRSHHMAADKAFLLPVVIDGTREGDARVPEKFWEVPWTRLPHGETPPSFINPVQRLLSSAAPPTPPAAPLQSAAAAPRGDPPRRHSSRARVGVLVGNAVALLGIGFLLIERFRTVPQPAT